MTTDPAAKAAAEICTTYDVGYPPELAAIIRRAYEPRERLLERAVAVIARLPIKATTDTSDAVLADADSMGIGRTPA